MSLQGEPIGPPNSQRAPGGSVQTFDCDGVEVFERSIVDWIFRSSPFLYTNQAVLQGVAFRRLPSGSASFIVEKAHFAARKKGPENRKNEAKLRELEADTVRDAEERHHQQHENHTRTMAELCPQPEHDARGGAGKEEAWQQIAKDEEPETQLHS